jgi:Uma2 family endonuclease
MATTDLEAVLEIPESLFRMTVEQYHAMIRAGVLGTEDRVELLEGILVRKMSKNPPHRAVVSALVTLMVRALPAGWHYQVQDPITLSDGEPEPDGAVVRGGPKDYPGGHPTPRDVALVIEVADDSLPIDRGTKLRSYARAGIREYWLVNLIDMAVEVYTRPGKKRGVPGYAGPVVKKRGEELRVPAEAGGAVIAVSDVLP